MKNYDDIINLPRPILINHPKMSIYNRAAQFSPFAALKGYETAIDNIRLEVEKFYDKKECKEDDFLIL